MEDMLTKQECLQKSSINTLENASQMQCTQVARLSKSTNMKGKPQSSSRALMKQISACLKRISSVTPS